MNVKTAALIGLIGFRFPSCYTREAPSFKVYSNAEHLPLPSGDTLKVYRVRYITFIHGGGAAVEFEYQASIPIHGASGNTPLTKEEIGRLRREARAIWPSLVGYATAQGVTEAMVVPSTFHSWGLPWNKRSMVASLPLMASKGPDGRWRFEHDSAALPALDSTVVPRIIDVDGRPLPFRFPHTGEHECQAIDRTPLICP